MKALASLLLAAAALLGTSCTLTDKAPLEGLSLDELAARVPAYDDATPVHHRALPDIKTIGELRAALAGGLDPNGRAVTKWGYTDWYMECDSPFTSFDKYDKEALAKERLACLDVLLRAGGDPQKHRPLGEDEEQAVAYALLIRHGLHADEPFTLTPEHIAKYGQHEENYPLWSGVLTSLPESVLVWLLENGAPINEHFNGRTLLMELCDQLWHAALAEADPRGQTAEARRNEQREAEAAWEKSYRVAELLLAHGADPRLRDTLGTGYAAIDYVPLLGKETGEAHPRHYSPACRERARKLERLLLAHGSPARRAPMYEGEGMKAFYRGGGSVSWDDAYLDKLERERVARLKAERRAREARLKPLRATRRAAEAGKQK